MSTGTYLRLIGSGGAAAQIEGPDAAEAHSFFLMMCIMAPTQILTALTLTPELRHKLVEWLGSLEADEPHPLPTDATTDASTDDCVICMDAEATHILAPCGHLCVCAACACQLVHMEGDATSTEWRKSAECPICRRIVESVVAKVWATGGAGRAEAYI